MSNEIVHVPSQNELFMPVMNVALAIQRRDQIVQFVSSIMRKDTDYGKVPGTTKDVLLKPGAEKLTTFFGLTPVFVPVRVVEDWTGTEHGGEPFFNYCYKCELWRMGTLISTCEGSCNSRESKYRYRKAERECPVCGKPAIRKAKEEDRGYYCWKKIDGCGATFPPGDKRIESQEVGRVLNPDIADQVNTIQKMAQKRAFVGATIIACNASEFFTQDLEDLAETVVEGSYTVVEQPKKVASPPARHRQPVEPNKPIPAPEIPAANGAQPAPDDILTDKTLPEPILAFVGELRGQERPGAKKASPKQHNYAAGIVDNVTGEQTHRQVFKVVFNRDVTADEPLSEAAFKLIHKYLSEKKSVKQGDEWVNVTNDDYSPDHVNMVKVIHAWAMETRGQMTIEPAVAEDGYDRASEIPF